MNREIKENSFVLDRSAKILDRHLLCAEQLDMYHSRQTQTCRECTCSTNQMLRHNMSTVEINAVVNHRSGGVGRSTIVHVSVEAGRSAAPVDRLRTAGPAQLHLQAPGKCSLVLRRTEKMNKPVHMCTCWKQPAWTRTNHRLGIAYVPC